jgi:hypothetical protein
VVRWAAGRVEGAVLISLVIAACVIDDGEVDAGWVVAYDDSYFH